MTEHGMGWKPSPPDDRDWAPDRLKLMVDAGLAVPVAWDCPVWLNQGRSQKCVGYSGATWVASSSSTTEADVTVTNALGEELYQECKATEGVMPGDPDFDTGSTLRALAQVLRARGVAAAYSLTNDFCAADAWCSQYGPVELGIPWYEGMFTKDAQGVIHPTGELAGGHAIVWLAKDQPLNRWHNTWGQEWGECDISDEDIKWLMELWGEALLMVKLAQPAPPPKPEPFSDISDLDFEGYAGVHLAYSNGWVAGHLDGTFRPYAPLLKRHVALIAGRAGLTVPGTWLLDYSLALRGEVATTWPSFVWTQEDWEVALTRVQLMRLLWRARTT